MTANRMSWMALTGACWSLLSALALAQPEGPPRDMLPPGSNLAELGLQDSVREQIGITEKEAEALKPLVDEITHSREVAWRASRKLERDERRKKMQELSATNDKKVADAMEPDHFKRLRQISLQVEGPAAFRDPEVIATLAMTSDQLEQSDKIRREGREEMTKAFSGVTNFNANIFDKAREISDGTRDKIVALLTAEQQQKLNVMLGETFHGKLVFDGIAVNR